MLMDNAPKVSLVVPCYNKNKYIGEMLDSVLAQVYNNIELILVDDGSFDGTERIIRDYIPKINERGFEIVVVRQLNQGVARACKHGLMRATGNFICFPDCDDVLHNDYVSYMAEYLIEHEDCEAVRCLHDGYKLLPYLVDTDISVAVMISALSFYAWCYMIRKTFADRVQLIENFYAPLGCVNQEPQIVEPIVNLAKNLILLRKELYTYRRYPDGLQGEMRVNLDKAREFCDTNYDILLREIKAYNLPEINKLYAMIFCERSRFHTGLIPLDEHNNRMLEIAKNAGIKLRHEEKSIFYAVAENLIGVKQLIKTDFVYSLHGRLVFYGVLGKNYIRKKDYFNNSEIKADIMIDKGATEFLLDGQKVCRPEDYTPERDDTIVVFPIKNEIVEEVKTVYENPVFNIRVFSVKDIIELRVKKNEN
jgi:glycosyltransferase involved in cell wall biosynthesis